MKFAAKIGIIQARNRFFVKQITNKNIFSGVLQNALQQKKRRVILSGNFLRLLFMNPVRNKDAQLVQSK